jgi:subtilisin family serine protease
MEAVMNKRRSIWLTISVVSAVLLIAFTPLPVTGVQAADIPTRPSAVIETSNPAITHSLPFAPGVVLLGLKRGISVDRGVRGAQVTDPTLSEIFARLGVLDVEPVFSRASSAPFTAGTLNTEGLANLDLSSSYRLRLSPDADVLQVVQELRSSSAVEYAEPDYLARIITTPNDPEYADQWGLPKINAPAAWDTTTGSSGVVIAVVDAGIDPTHADLSGQLWQNPGEIAANGIDDDNDGYVDDIHGWNLVNNQ